MIITNLWGNGAADPDQWRPRQQTYGLGLDRIKVGALIGWRYGAWRITELTPRADVDLTDDDRERRATSIWSRPHAVVLTHESGPRLLKPGEPSQRLHDGRHTVHFTASISTLSSALHVLSEPYQMCSCHGHIWPCQEIDLVAYSAAMGEQMNRIEAAHAPGVCAACRGPISTRQKTVTFPEPSRLLPGAPGPTFHAGKVDCWLKAEEYERGGRLADDPDVTRIASCPGVRFAHQNPATPRELRTECTAGLLCTGLHGPIQTATHCYTAVRLASNEGAYARPSYDCGHSEPRYRERCLGGDLSMGAESLSPIAADLLWREQEERKRRGH